MARLGSFQSCHGENDPDPESGQDLDSDKPVCSTSCQEDVTTHHFCVPFCGFVPDSTTFATNPRVVESVTGSVQVEYRHKAKCSI